MNSIKHYGIKHYGIKHYHSLYHFIVLVLCPYLCCFNSLLQISSASFPATELAVFNENTLIQFFQVCVKTSGAHMNTETGFFLTVIIHSVNTGN